jgi:hypothetical protein
MTTPIQQLEKKVDVWKILRWIGLIVGALVVLKMAQCGAAKYQEQTDQINAAKKNADHWKAMADTSDSTGARKAREFELSLDSIAKTKAKVVIITHRTDSSAHTIQVLGPASPPTPSGAVPLDSTSEADTTSYDRILQTTTGKTFVIPRFITAQLASYAQSMAALGNLNEQNESALRKAQAIIRQDTIGMRARDSVIANLRIAEATAEARGAPRFGFKTGTLVGALGTLVVVVPTALVVNSLNKGK